MKRIFLPITKVTLFSIAFLFLSCSKDEDEPIREYVDLGLSVKWSTCNVGASKPEECGEYYAWGELNTKEIYGIDTYKFSVSGSYTKYVTVSHGGWSDFKDGKTKLDLEDDVAHGKWGDGWRMPTRSEMKELIDNCTWTKTVQNGMAGYIVKSKKSGFTDKSIFLPAAGQRYANVIDNVGVFGYYWTSNLDASDQLDYASYALFFKTSEIRMSSQARSYGIPIRPVCP